MRGKYTKFFVEESQKKVETMGLYSSFSLSPLPLPPSPSPSSSSISK